MSVVVRYHDQMDQAYILAILLFLYGDAGSHMCVRELFESWPDMLFMSIRSPNSGGSSFRGGCLC